ncbi:MAG: LytR/AlgR family response regulator transcription factor, partial [Oscillospiraceae bacterium]
EKRRNGIPVKTLTIRNKGETVSLRYDNIYYFEKAGHRISVHTTAGDYNFYGKFVALLAEIDPGCFVQCHQGYVANIGKIRAFRDKTLFLEGDISLPVSRSYTDTVKNILAERLFAGKDSR